MKIHQIFVKDYRHSMLFLTHFLVPLQFILVLHLARQYYEASYLAATNFVKFSISQCKFGENWKLRP